MEELVKQIMANFDFTLMLSINVGAYVVIKFIDEMDGDKVPPVWLKRLVFVVMAALISAVYVYTGTDTLITAINSVILAPVSWSWIFRPILNKLGYGYKQKEQ